VPLLQQRGFARVIHCGECVLGLLAAWFFFYLIGEILLALPPSFHEAALWQSN
jgi:hypothetical protein